MHRYLVLLAAVAAIASDGGSASAQSVRTVESTVSITLPALEVQQDGNAAVLAMDGFDPFGQPGDPQLLSHIYRLVLPQACDAATVSVRVRATSKETVQLPAPPLACPEVFDVLGVGNLVPIPRADGAQLVGGLNPAIYGTDALYPDSYLRKTRVVDQLGWKLLEVEVIAARLNPVTERARVAKTIEVTATYQTAPGTLPPVSADPSIRRLVLQQGLQDWNTVAQTYDVAAASSTVDRGGYLIVTTAGVEADRPENGLQAFIDHKRRLGFRVRLQTTEQIAQRYPTLSGSAVQIRREIRERYRANGTRYVLLVGNPDANADQLRRSAFKDRSVLPMQRCYTASQGSRTDMYYTDVDGSWDPDGDGDLAERWADVGRPEIAVGRIAPVGGYIHDIHRHERSKVGESVTRQVKLRTVFEKLIRYDLEIDKSWRRSMFLTGSYMYGSGFRSTAHTLRGTRAAIRHADPAFEAYTVYQDGTPYRSFPWRTDPWFDGRPNPEADERLYGEDHVLVGPTTPLTVLDTSTAYTSWCQRPAGFLLWRGHGSGTGVAVGGGDGVASTDDGALFDRDWFLKRSSPSGTLPDDDHPAVVYSSSCNNLKPGTAQSGVDLDEQVSLWANLAATMQYRGAVAVVAATHLTSSDKSGQANPSIGKSTWYQRQFAVSIARGSSFGMAFLKAKQDAEAHFAGDTTWNKRKLRDWLRINLLGDPSQRMFFDHAQIPDDEYDAFESGNAPAASLQNDTRATAATIYRGPTDATAAPAHIEVRVMGCVLKDADWYRLKNLGTRRKQVQVRVGRELPMGEVRLRFRAADGTEIASRVDAEDDSVTFSLTLPRADRELYLVVRPTTHVTDYDLTVTVDR